MAATQVIRRRALLILIHDPGTEPPTVATDFDHLLQLEFHDVSYENDFDVVFDFKMANAIKQALVTQGLGTIMVACERGYSRSPAIAAAIDEFLNGKESLIHWDSRYEPNPLAYRKLSERIERAYHTSRESGAP